MNKIFKGAKFSFLFLFLSLSFIACDKDFNTIESDVLGKDNANFNTDNANIQILAYNKKLDSLQINSLASNLLGVFNDPAYGLTTASIITQVTPTSFNPDFGTNTIIDSVVLRVPYYSKINGTDDAGNATYSISDSLYGSDPIDPIKLSIYQNNYFLRDFNPNSTFNERQNYYSKANGSINSTDNFAITENGPINFDNNKGASVINPSLLENYIPNTNAIVLVTNRGETSELTERLTPSLRVKLDIPFWKAAIIDKNGQSVLSNANNFKDYFRGLYFKAEAIDGKGNMILMNFASTDANITIYYSKDSTVAGERTSSNYRLNFTGNRLNTFINNFTGVTLVDGDKTYGDERLYLKGAEGSMAIVDLFNGTVDCNGSQTTALECFKKTYRKTDASGTYVTKNGDFVLKNLINEAHLVIYEDNSINTGGDDTFHKYDRLYAYDLKNNITTIDYSLDPSENTTLPVNSKFISLGQRQTDDAGVSKYKIRLTEHLNNILLRDSTNTKIGLVLSNNVNYTANAQILNSKDVVTSVPAASLLMPRGTVLYGTRNSVLVPENRKMRLEIFFTEPNY